MFGIKESNESVPNKGADNLKANVHRHGSGANSGKGIGKDPADGHSRVGKDAAGREKVTAANPGRHGRRHRVLVARSDASVNDH